MGGYNLQLFHVSSLSYLLIYHTCFNTKQESPPAWTQEAYRPPCSEYSFCCPTRVPPPGGGGGGVPDLGTPPGGVPDPGTPPPRGGGGTWPGYPPLPPGGGGGVPDPGTPPPPPGGGGGTGPGYPPPPPGGGGYPDPPSPPRCGQTNKVKLLPSRHTTYAGGKNHSTFNQGSAGLYMEILTDRLITFFFIFYYKWTWKTQI